MSPVFPIDIDISKNDVLKQADREYVESVEHKSKKYVNEKKVMV